MSFVYSFLYFFVVCNKITLFNCFSVISMVSVVSEFSTWQCSRSCSSDKNNGAGLQTDNVTEKADYNQVINCFLLAI